MRTNLQPFKVDLTINICKGKTPVLLSSAVKLKEAVDRNVLLRRPNNKDHMAHHQNTKKEKQDIKQEDRYDRPGCH